MISFIRLAYKPFELVLVNAAGEENLLAQLFSLHLKTVKYSLLFFEIVYTIWRFCDGIA